MNSMILDVMDKREYKLLLAAKIRFEDHVGHTMALKLGPGSVAFGKLTRVTLLDSSVLLWIDRGPQGEVSFFADQAVKCACEDKRDS